MAAGPEHSFDDFYAASAPSLLRQLHALTGDLSEAQDCLQEAYARAWQRWSHVSTQDVPEAWVRKVAWRLAVSRFRRARHGLSLSRRTVRPDAPGPTSDHVDLVAALRQLPEAQRTAVVLHHLADLSVEQVAAETGVPTGTAKARLARGRRRLAELLGDEDLPRGAPEPPRRPDLHDPQDRRRPGPRPAGRGPATVADQPARQDALGHLAPSSVFPQPDARPSTGAHHA